MYKIINYLGQMEIELNVTSLYLHGRDIMNIFLKSCAVPVYCTYVLPWYVGSSHTRTSLISTLSLRKIGALMYILLTLCALESTKLNGFAVIYCMHLIILHFTYLNPNTNIGGPGNISLCAYIQYVFIEIILACNCSGIRGCIFFVIILSIEFI